MYRQVYITQLLTNGCVLHGIWKKMTWKCWLVFFLMHWINMRRDVEHFPKKMGGGGGGGGGTGNRSHLRVLLVKHTNIMYIYFFNFKSHFNWNMLIGCFFIDIAKLIENEWKSLLKLGCLFEEQSCNWSILKCEREREREREREGSWMVWRCISSHCKLELVTIQGNLTGDQYVLKVKWHSYRDFWTVKVNI